MADIDWIEASGNYALLHVGGETLEIRSSLTKLEGELDPKRFVRVHKSYVVNIARVAEVTPWVSGDWRIRLQDGAEVNLSRRYRQRFEAAGRSGVVRTLTSGPVGHLSWTEVQRAPDVPPGLAGRPTGSAPVVTNSDTNQRSSKDRSRSLFRRGAVACRFRHPPRRSRLAAGPGLRPR